MTLQSTERGMALVVVALTLVLVLAIAAGLVLATTSEALTAENFRRSQQGLYAAEAAAEWVVADLPGVANDWPTVLNTTVTSRFVDGPAGGSRALGDGSFLNLTDVVDRNVSWKPYAWGPLRDLLPPPSGPAELSMFYVVVFVAPDAESPDHLQVRAEAHGPRGAHKMLDLRLLRDSSGVHVVSWAERR
jgi:PilX N-terminal